VGTWVLICMSGHLSGHYTQVAPSQQLIQEWNRIITLKWMQEPDVPNSLAQDSTQQLIRNGIFFPIWNMNPCDLNDSARRKHHLRNNRITVNWFPSKTEFDQRVQEGMTEKAPRGTALLFTLLTFTLSPSCTHTFID